MSSPPPRRARLVLVDRAGAPLGALPPLDVDTPWWPDVGPVVRAVRAAYGLDVTVLRLLSSERSQPHGGLVTYLAECARVDRAPDGAPGALDDHPLRLAYARPGGPAADLAWADAALARHGRVRRAAEQVRTWNLSSLWRLDTDDRAVWLKVVPGFFAHEGALLAALAGEPVPRLLAHERGRVLLDELPGEDRHDACQLDELGAMIALAVRLQASWLGRGEALRAFGLPDFGLPSLRGAIADVLERTAGELAGDEVATLRRFVDDLPARAKALAACGLPDTLVHGDLHPGNFRGGAGGLALLDWGDSGVGHPLLDQPAFLERVGEPDRPAVRALWSSVWRAHRPGSEPERAAELLAPVAAARQAVIYRRFLDGIEPSEQVYHRDDPARWLRRAAGLLAR